MKNTLLEKLVKYKVLFFSLGLIMTFTYIIRNDYVAADAYAEPSDDYVFITDDDPAEVKISVCGRKVNSILFSLQNPEILSEAVTRIGLYDGEVNVAEIELCHNSVCEVTDSLGNATELFWNPGGVETDPSKEYSLRISSNAADPRHAFGFRLNQERAVWSRITYLLLSAAQRKLFFAGAAVLLTLSLYVIWQRRKEYFSRPEKFFLLASLFLCPLYLVCVPVFQVPDEVNHYVRAYGIVHGYLLSPEEGMIPIPANLIPYQWYTYTPYILWNHFKMNISTTEGILHNNVNMALYSPVSYVFQVIGIGAADLFCDNSHVLILAGRIANILGCTAILYYAIKFIPYGKWAIVFISMLPMSLQERASLSVDAITCAAAAAMLSFCLYIRHKKIKMGCRELGLMYALTALVSSCKVVYFPAAFLILLIPAESFADRRRELVHKAAGCLETVVLSLGWLAIAGNYLGSTRAGGDAAQKLRFICSSPGRYLYILDKTFWEDEGKLIGEMLGSKLGSLDITVNVMLLFFIMVLFFKIYYREKEKREQPDYPASLFMVMSGCTMVLLIATSLYLQWTVIGASTYSIEGLQGRYFLPVLPFVVCAFLSTKDNSKMTKASGGMNVRVCVGGG